MDQSDTVASLACLENEIALGWILSLRKRYVRLKLNLWTSKNPMLTLNQIISEATALSDSDKAVLIEKVMESMTEQREAASFQGRLISKTERSSAIDRMRGLLKTDQATPTDQEVAAMLDERRLEKYLG